MVARRVALVKVRREIAPLLTIMDSVGTSVEEVDEYAKLNNLTLCFVISLTSFVLLVSSIVVTNA